MPLRERLSRAIHQKLRYSTKAYLPDRCHELGLPDARYEDTFTNKQYIQTRLDKITDADTLCRIAEDYTIRYPLGLPDNHQTFEIEELLWQDGDRQVPSWVRRKLVVGLDHTDLYTDGEEFLKVLGSLFVLDKEPSFAMSLIDSRTLREKILEDFVRNSGSWSVKDLFREFGAFACTSERFCRLIEAFTSQGGCPERSRAFVASANKALGNTGFEIVKSGEVGAIPAFSFTRDSEPKTKIYRFYDIVENHAISPLFAVLSLILIFMTTWISVSISYFLSQHSLPAGAVTVLIITAYLLFLYAVLKELRWWWIVSAAALFVSACKAIYGGDYGYFAVFLAGSCCTSNCSSYLGAPENGTPDETRRAQ